MEQFHIQKCLNANKLYFKAFNEKDLSGLSNIYSSNVTLTDWTGQWVKSDNVLLENSNFFQKEFNLIINGTTIDIDNNMNMIRTINDITIQIKNESNNITATIDVIDEILFDKDGKIYSITARQK